MVSAFSIALNVVVAAAAVVAIAATSGVAITYNECDAIKGSL